MIMFSSVVIVHIKQTVFLCTVNHNILQEKIAKTKGDQKELFKIVKTLLCLK